MTIFNFKKLPFQGGTVRQISDAVNNIIDGKINATGSVTLTDNSATSVVTDQRVSADSVILFMPTNSGGATELASGSMYVSSRGKQTFTITNTNSATSRTFDYIVIG